MKALRFDKTAHIEDIPRPVRKRGEALIKPLMAGICNTDLEIIKGYMDFKGVPGHEFVGIVKESDSLTGKRVVGEINAGCGECRYCLKGDPRHCPERTVLGIQGRNGAFAEYFVLPDKNLHVLPDGMSGERAVFCEPLAAALRITEQINIENSKNILVIGDGKLGLLAAQVLSERAPTKLLGDNTRKIEAARRIGLNIYDEKISEKFSIIVEASGNPSGLRLAAGLVRPRGTIVLKSTYHGSMSFDPAPLVVNEVTLLGSRCGPFEPALKMLDGNRLKTDFMISKTYPFNDILDALETAGRPETLKVLVKFD